ncbi:MAG: anti-sigma factor [bacterium]
MQRRFAGYGTYKRRSQRGALAVQLMIITFALIGGAGYFAANNNPSEVKTEAVSVAAVNAAPSSSPKSDLDQTLELRDTTGGKTQARFTRKITDGKSVFSVIGELPKPENNYYYEVWAVQPDPYKFMSLGAMILRTDDKFGLAFEVKDDLRGFSEIIITLEKNDKNPAPSTHILEGKF